MHVQPLLEIEHQPEQPAEFADQYVQLGFGPLHDQQLLALLVGA
jgi:hypothetical protein